MRIIHIYCDGGFGNRFNALVSGLALAELAHLDPLVVWPVNNWCRAKFNDLLLNTNKVIDRELITYTNEKENYQFFMSEDHLGMGVPFKSPLILNSIHEALEYIAESSKDVFYYTPLIPKYFDEQVISNYIKSINFLDHIVERAENFIKTNSLNEFYGIQIRKTDFGINASDEKNLYEVISNCPHKKFFVCSDDKFVEDTFKILNNVVIYDKKAHVEKLIAGDWNKLTADCSGRVYPCNVNRSKQSVEDAIVDLLILSRSTIVKTCNSTFLNTALLLKTHKI